MFEKEIALAVEEWLKGVLPELNKTWPFATAAKTDLPDAVIEVLNKGIQLGGEDTRFPWAELQQRLIKVFDIKISFMVDALEAPEDPTDAEATDGELKVFGEKVETALLAEPTLGDRVQMASPICSANYALPFVGYPDGTRGRQMVFEMSVAELVDNEE